MNSLLVVKNLFHVLKAFDLINACVALKMISFEIFYNALCLMCCYKQLVLNYNFI